MVMYRKVKVGGHPLHPMLVAFPVVLYTATLVCFVVQRLSGDLFWFRTGWIANCAGVCAALIRHIIAEGRAEGHGTIYLSALTGGYAEGLYARLGFEPLFTVATYELPERR